MLHDWTKTARRHSAPILRRALISATMLIPAATAVEAAKLPLVIKPASDPLFSNLAIPANAPTQGMWSSVQSWPLVAASVALLPNGKIASWGSSVTTDANAAVQDGRSFAIWDPIGGFASGSFVILPPESGINSFCGTQAFQADGSMLLAGGIFDNNIDKGTAVLNAGASGITNLSAKMAYDRYYATMITLGNGQQLIMGGNFPYAGGWNDPDGSLAKGYQSGMTPELFYGNAWHSLFGANSRDAFGPDNSRWWYPRAWVMPSGKVFGISSDKMWTLDPTGNGALTAMPFRAAQKAANVATDAPNVGPSSTAVMYDVGKILQVGGNSYDNGTGFLASSLATIVDITGANPVATETKPMTYGRSWANATVLPTGKVFVNGGSLFDDQAGDKTVLASEIWDPATGTWTVGASGANYRGYHSSAALMQNGAVLVAGGGIPGPVNNLNAEIYYPPYLFTTTNGKVTLAPRPQIASLSTNQLTYGKSMQIELAGTDQIAQVVLIGLSQGTHSFNSGQRRYPATVSQSGTLATVQAPASGNIAPPGYYQLVAINANGVPSAGVIVALGAGIAAPSQVSVPVAATTQNAGGSGGTGTGGTGTGGTGTAGGTGTGGTAGTGGTTTTGTGTAAGSATGTPVSLQASNYPANYLQNVGGTARLVAPASAADRQQSTFRLVPGLAGKGVSFQSSTSATQYLRHQNFQIYQQANDSGDVFKTGSTFTPVNALAGTCGCNTGLCASYQSIDWPGYYIRHKDFNFYLAKSDGSALFNQDASFCVAPPLDGSTVSLQASNYPADYLQNVGGTARLTAPASTADRQQSTFRLVAGLAGQGVSFQSSASATQYLRHQNFQIYQQANDNGNTFKTGSTFTPGNALAGTCGCNAGLCASYQSTDWPGYYIRHKDFNFYLAKSDGSALFNQDASFCVAPGLQP